MNHVTFYVRGEEAFNLVDAQADDWVRTEFYELAATLVNNARPPGSLPLKGVAPTPPSFSAPFDDGFVAYQVFEDETPPRIVLLSPPIWADS